MLVPASGREPSNGGFIPATLKGERRLAVVSDSDANTGITRVAPGVILLPLGLRAFPESGIMLVQRLLQPCTSRA